MERNFNMRAVAAVTLVLTGGAAERAIATHPHPETQGPSAELREPTEAQKNCARLAATAFEGFNYAFNANKTKINVDPQNPTEYNCDPEDFNRTTVARVSEYRSGKFVKHLTNRVTMLTPANDGGAKAERTVKNDKATCGRATKMAITSTVTIPGTNFKVVNTDRTSSVATKCTVTRR